MGLKYVNDNPNVEEQARQAVEDARRQFPRSVTPPITPVPMKFRDRDPRRPLPDFWPTYDPNAGVAWPGKKR